MGVVRNIVNDQLLMLSYKDPKNIRHFLRNWGGLESLSLRGDRVATCILADLKIVTGIDPEKYNRADKSEFNKGYLAGKLSHYQYMSIAYTLVLGYSQEEIAYVMLCWRWINLSKFRREEDEADLWLREHDPYYTAPDRNKRKQVEYPYDTPEQERRRREQEIPISNLNSFQKVQFKQIAGAYNEKGEFEM